MKTATIENILKSELLVVELPEGSTHQITLTLLAIHHANGDIKLFKGSYTLLGSPDEIREEDASELVDSLPNPMSQNRDYKDYTKTHSFMNNAYLFATAKDSLLSAIETVIYWDVNPLGKYATAYKRHIITGTWQEHESRTFDRKRTIILKKN